MTFIFSHFCCLLRRLIALQLWFVSIVPVWHSPFAAGGVCGVQCAHSKMKMQQEVNIKSDLRLRHIIYCQYLLEQSFLSCVFFARGKRSNERLALRFLWILCKVCLCMAFNVVESVCVRFSGGNLIQLEKLKTIQLAPMKIEPQSPIPNPQTSIKIWQKEWICIELNRAECTLKCSHLQSCCLSITVLSMNRVGCRHIKLKSHYSIILSIENGIIIPIPELSPTAQLHLEWNRIFGVSIWPLNSGIGKYYWTCNGTPINRYFALKI